MVNRYMACGHDLQSYDASSSAGMDVVVLASDYAALEAELNDVRDGTARLKMGFDHIEAERDELKRRMYNVCAYASNSSILSGVRLIAIAEGRDNG